MKIYINITHIFPALYLIGVMGVIESVKEFSITRFFMRKNWVYVKQHCGLLICRI